LAGFVSFFATVQLEKTRSMHVRISGRTYERTNKGDTPASALAQSAFRSRLTVSDAKARLCGHSSG
jgi:hypothetical protein